LVEYSLHFLLVFFQLCKKYLFVCTLTLSTILISQPSPEFDPFDWVTYRKTGGIQSITEGFTYIYFGTEEGGILRYHTFQNQFDDPITEAQGLSSNRIMAVHFDSETGTLWAATKNGLNYSFTREGNWTSISYGSLALPRKATIYRIGSSNAYIWIDAGSSFLKLDRIAGISLGVFTIPDEEDIRWSSRSIYGGIHIPEEIANFTVTEGWLLNGNYFIDPYGQNMKITSFYQTKYSDIWLGTESGYLFLGDSQMETYYPFSFGLANSDVTAFTKGNEFWISGRSGFNSDGITSFRWEEILFQHYYPDATINMSNQSIYCSLETDKELWFGGNHGLLLYNKKDGFWRLYDETRGLPGGTIISMAQDTSHVWIGTSQGISRIHKISKRSRPTGIESYFDDSFIFDLEVIDNQVWIGTNSQLFIFDIDSQVLYDFRELGDVSLISDQHDLYRNFWEIHEHDKTVYAANDLGLISFDLVTGKWSTIFETAHFGNQKINSLAFSDEYCFLGTNFGLYRIDLKQFFRKDYTYSFIGQVNELFISDDILWIGTNRGLTKYLWTRDF